MSLNCACGTGKTYLNCCGIFINNKKLPATPEELMRSRYTAYSQSNIDYIIQTMKPPAADNFDHEAAEEWAKQIKFTRLEIIKTTYDSTKGRVEFLAYYDLNDKKNVLHEISEFNFESGRWYYVNGQQSNKKLIANAILKTGRNDICPCGSNKKYKKCCGA